MTRSSLSSFSIFNDVNLPTQETNGKVGRSAGAATKGAETARGNANKLDYLGRTTGQAINKTQPLVTNAFTTQITGIEQYIYSIGQVKASGPA